MSKGGRYAKHKEKQPRKPLGGKKIALIVVAVLLVLVIAVVIFGVAYYNSMLNKVSRAEFTPNSISDEELEAIMNYNPDAPTADAETTQAATELTTVPTTLPYTESGKDIINILVVGQSARDGEDARMADTMILATVNKTTKTLTLTSFLRDTYLKLPNYKDSTGRQHTCGEQRINVCYHLGWTWDGTAGAMAMMNQCLRENFGIEVDYNIEIDFDAFVKVVDMLDGIEIELTEAEAEYLNNDDVWVYYDVEPGLTRLDGMAALSYARMRKAAGDSDSDIKRTSRQRVLIEKIFEKVKAWSFASLQKMANEVLPMITTNMTNDQITTCIWEILPLLSELKIETGTCPVETTYWGEIVQIGGYDASVLKFDQGQNRKLRMAITEGTE